MIRILHFTTYNVVPLEHNSPALKEALQARSGVVWVDMQAEPDANCLPLMRDVFAFSPLAIEDALQQAHIPKIDNWQDYIYLVLHTVDPTLDVKGNLNTLELDVFFGRRYIVTHHDLPIPALEEIWQRFGSGSRQLKPASADYLLYQLSAQIAGDYLRFVDALDELADGLQDQILDDGRQQQLGLTKELFTLKRQLLLLRRIIAPQREVYDKLARDTYSLVESRDRMLFSDIYDHYFRLHNLVENLRDLVSGVVDIYLSVVNNRMNNIIKVLTVITTVMMPISFITSFFGMNFFLPREPVFQLMEMPVFIGMLSLIVILPASMLLWLKRRGWL